MITVATSARWAVAFLTGALLTLAGCGGGGSVAASSTPTTVNNVAVIVDTGPPLVDAVNSLYITVTLCAPGDNSQCQTIDHVLVDTGSTGFRVLASVLGNGVSPAQLGAVTDANGNAIVECTQFVDGYSWGPVKTATLQIAGEVASNVPIQVIGDPDYPSSQIPSGCINVPNAEEDTVQQFGANGVLGVGNFLQDCGSYCAQDGIQDGSAYNACSMSAPFSCTPVSLAVNQQVANPVAMFSRDNNGVLIQFAPQGDADQPSASGGLFFGIGTQSNNALGTATVYALDPTYGTLQTTYDGVTLSQSYIDSGSDGYFLPDSSIAVCSDQSYFYCPATPLALSAQIQDIDGYFATIPFSVSSADSLVAGDAVAPDLAGPAGSNSMQSFDWGLPFFYGRSVYVIFEGAVVGGQPGPAVAF